MKNTFVKVLSMMIALMMVVGVFSTITVTAAGCTHENKSAVHVKPATCDEAGFTQYRCNDCEKEFIGDLVMATGKHELEDVGYIDATCTEPAYGPHKACKNCDYTEGKLPVEGSPENGLGHVFEKPYTEAATCTKPGFTSLQCIRCEEISEEHKVTLPAGHKFVYEVVTAPTVCSDGYVKVTCSACDDYEEIIVDNDANHTWITISNLGETCMNDYVSGHVCSTCGAYSTDAVKNTKKEHNYVQVSFATVTDENITADIKGLGYNIGDATFNIVTATCTTSKIYLAQCTLCNDYDVKETKVNNGNGHKWGAWGDYSPADDAAHHNVDKTRTRTCENCSAVDTDVKVGDNNHRYETAASKNVVPSTCTTNGYTDYKCDDCGDELRADPTFKTGHDYKTVWKEGTCGTSAMTYVQVCEKEGCLAPEIPATTIPEGADECKWEKVLRDPTCVEAAYYEYECSVCGNTKDYDGEDKPTVVYVEGTHKHVVEITLSRGQKVTTTAIKNATCTTKAEYRYHCECGELVDVEEGTALGHDEGTEYHTGHDANDNCSSRCVSVAEKDANCKETGISEAGVICARCGEILDEPTRTSINPDVHKLPATATVDEDVATCARPAYTSKYYPCCEFVDTIETGDKNANNHVRYSNKAAADQISLIKKVDAKGATCLEDGYLEHYKCSGCNALFEDAAGTTPTNAAAIKETNPQNNFQHDWSTTLQAKVEEKCAVDGSYAYYKCSNENCTAILIVKSETETQVVEGRAKKTSASDPINKQYPALTIPQHGTYYQDWHKGQEPTCTTDGYRYHDDFTAAYVCSKCNLITKAQDSSLAATGHNYVDSKPQNLDADGKVIDCRYDTYVVLICECGYQCFDDYKANDGKGHEFLDEDGEYINSNKIQDVTCTQDERFEHKCTKCLQKEYSTGTKATGHKITVNGVKIDVSFDCQSKDHTNYAGFACSCGKELGEYFEHVVVKADAKFATCTENGNSEFRYCKNCQEAFDTVVVTPATGHLHTVEIAVVDNVAEIYCYDCGVTYFENVESASVTISTDAAAVTAGDEVSVTIDIDLINVSFNVLEITLGAGEFSANDVNAVATGFGTDVEVIANGKKVSIYPENTSETVTLASGSDASVTFTLNVGLAAENFNVTVTDIVAYVSENGVATDKDVEFKCESAAVAVAMLGNVNGDTLITDGTPVINAADYKEVYLYAQSVITGTAQYDAKYDINRDGAINVADAMAIKAFVLSEKTAEDYLTMINYDFEKLDDSVAGESYTKLLGKDLATLLAPVED